MYRRRRGLSQAALAGLVGRSESWLSQVERGLRSVDRLSVLLDMSRVLHVDVQQLSGRPWHLAPDSESAVDELNELRRLLTRYERLVDVEPGPQVALADLRSSVNTAHRTYQAARYQEAIEQLPRILRDVDRINWRDTGENHRGMLHEYVSAYVVAAKLLTKVGATDLAMLAADRAATCAMSSDSAVARGMSAYQVSCALLRADRSDEAEDVAVNMAEQLQPCTRADKPRLLSLTGALWLIAAVIAARRTDREEAWARLDRAEALADLLDDDANHAWTAFGPTNVLLHRMTVATELGDPCEAGRIAADVDAGRLPEGLSSRRAQVHIELAWAQSQRKRDAEATLQLLAAERIAPEAVRYNVLVRELVLELLARTGRRQASALSDLATRSGVID